VSRRRGRELLGWSRYDAESGTTTYWCWRHAPHDRDLRRADHEVDRQAAAGAVCESCRVLLREIDGLPAHGPGCRELAGTTSVYGGSRYICVAQCPRRSALSREATRQQ